WQNEPACRVEGYESESDVYHPEDRSCRYAQAPASLGLDHHEGNDEESADDRDGAPERPGSENRSVTDYGAAIHTKRPRSYQAYSKVSPNSGKVSSSSFADRPVSTSNSSGKPDGPPFKLRTSRNRTRSSRPIGRR